MRHINEAATELSRTMVTCMERHNLIKTLHRLNVIGNFKTYSGRSLNWQVNHVHYTGYLNGFIYAVEFL